jgi:hypothetical protein
MPEGHHAELQYCALPGCGETFVQPQGGGERRLYCTHAHRATARRLRSFARCEADPVPEPVAIRRTSTPRPGRKVPAQGSGPNIAARWINDPFSLPTDA